MRSNSNRLSISTEIGLATYYRAVKVSTQQHDAARELDILEGGEGRVRVVHSKRAQKCTRCAVKCPRGTGTLYAAEFCCEKSPRGTGRFYERASDPNSTSQVANEPPQLGPREHQYCICTTRYCYLYCNQCANAITMQLHWQFGCERARIAVEVALAEHQY